MGLLSWMVLSLTVLLPAANSLPPVNEAQLQDIVSDILKRYADSQDQRKWPMFSLVVSIPFNSKTKTYDINQVPDDANNVKNTILNLNSEVYTGTKVVAATVLRYNDGTADHAEYRTLQNLKTIKKHIDVNDLLLIYVYASPCSARCTNSKKQSNILRFLQNYKNDKVVFVFSKVFKPSNTNLSAKALQEALQNLGGTIGLGRIFRCDIVNGRMKCVSCNRNGKVAEWCYDDNKPPA
ncbi:uncharacterized protein LOC122830003 [Gambusia affinis]|uniref:uncharacterized protein LOC122830003 n=1 Tax=Gambusia affinis TaxID=33528 RepID=UPI001CDBF56E|nr:uncharacterized protein LOC122830003 [Gambusia affinis]